METAGACLVWSHERRGFVAFPPLEFTVYPDDARKFTPEGAIEFVLGEGGFRECGGNVAVVEMLPDPIRMQQLVTRLLEGGLDGWADIRHE